MLTVHSGVREKQLTVILKRIRTLTTQSLKRKCDTCISWLVLVQIAYGQSETECYSLLILRYALVVAYLFFNQRVFF